ncbi:DUF4349 domain-containing protein [Chloroflexota bacterium]
MKKIMAIIGLLLATALLLFVSCSPAKIAEEGYGGEDKSPAQGVIVYEEAEEERAASAPPAVILSESSGLDLNLQSATERMIVRIGDMSLVVDGVSVAIEQITGMADGFGGYVVSSRVWKEMERLVGSIAIRVPAEYFDDSMKSLRGLAVDVTSEHSSSKDVTEEYVDLDAKLQNLEATERQLLVLMEKAETVEDILNVQRELSGTRGEIERTKARMQYLERTSATSLIQVHLEQSRLDIEFNADKRRGLKEGQKIQFAVRQIAGGFAPYSYEWDFGDGNISTEEAPTYAYKADGSYTVSLTVTDDRGNTDTEIRTDYITVIPGWSAGSIANGAWNGLVTFGHALANIFIWIGIFSPIWIVIGGIVYGVIYWRRRRKKAQ